MVLELVKKNRSYRRFQPGYTPDMETLRSLIELARFSATGKNRQLLRFHIVNSSDRAAKVYQSIKGWKMMLPGWGGQSEAERPPAYIVILNDTAQGNSMAEDVGIAAQSITLGATELGLGCCLIASFHRAQLQEALNLPAQYAPALLIAIGKPGEEVVLEEIIKGQNTAYWEDAGRVHHVPKLSLEDLIV